MRSFPKMSELGQTPDYLERAGFAASTTRVAYWANLLRSLRSYPMKGPIAEWMMEWVITPSAVVFAFLEFEFVANDAGAEDGG